MTASRGVDAAGSVGRRTAPDALVAAGAVPVRLVGGVDAAAAVACAAAPLAVLFVVAVLVNLVGAVDAAVTVARAAAIPAFCRHDVFPFRCASFQRVLYQKSGGGAASPPLLGQYAVSEK